MGFSADANLSVPGAKLYLLPTYPKGAKPLLIASPFQPMQISRFPGLGFIRRRPNNFLSSRAQAQP
jgi:hypothetical protein